MLSNKEIIETLLMIAESKGYGIGKFEKAIGVRVGYFSRVKREDKDIAFRVFRESIKVLNFKTFSELFEQIESSYEEYKRNEKFQLIIKSFGEITSENISAFVKILKDNKLIKEGDNK